jgi:outer membrane lipoprotein-sorting protein
MRTFAFAALALCTSTAFADPTGPEILAKVDQGINAFKDGTFEAKLRVLNNDGTSRDYQFTTFQKAPGKRLVRFNAPGDVKGMGVLIEDKDTIYVFLPGFQRIRRMGTHVKNQSFMGSDFGFDDMATLAYGNSYEAKLVGQEDKAFILELTAKKGIDPEFPRAKMWVDKENFYVVKMEHMDASGKKLKTQARSDYKKDSPTHWQPFKIEMTDHRRNDHKSEIVFTDTKIDTGLRDDLFSQRSLIRGN